MPKKKDCFGVEDYVCMTPNCPYARECIKVVWEKRLAKALDRGTQKPARRRSPGRVRATG
ncbi:MAG: hypothetical protein OER88_00755 [Planctomycetota bacterium]|nr:hypothetical protein [Planctomycetota bacterium]